MPRAKAEKEGRTGNHDLVEVGARDAIDRAGAELKRLANLAVDEGLMAMAGRLFIAESMVAKIGATFGAGVQEPLKKPRKARVRKVDDRQGDLLATGQAAESNGAHVSE